ncbi:MAG: DUF1036 domain-containing protein [Synergistales bacterium]|nr:DUF1036 domain-containing protein [Dethiosulfovibrio sp.]NCC97375.1 DUF1036 domain-containing protein [Synergistales bacterium]
MFGVNDVVKRVSVCLFTVLALLCVSHEASAAKITLVNKTSVKVSVALMWWADGSDNKGGTKGWYGVDPGKSRTILWNGIDGAAIQVGSMGYYAKGNGLVWRGNPGELQGWIHPKKAFETVTSDQAISGGQLVDFRMFNVEIGEDGSSAVGKIILRP